MTGYRRGFKTRAAAEEFHIARSLEPAYSSIYGPNRGSTFVVDPVERAHGRIYTVPYKARSKAGDIREYFASYVGA